MTDRDEKKARFAQQSRVTGPRKAVVAGVCAVLLVAAGATYLLAPNGDANSDRSRTGGGQTVEASRPVRLNAAPVKATAEGGNLSIPMADQGMARLKALASYARIA